MDYKTNLSINTCWVNKLSEKKKKESVSKSLQQVGSENTGSMAREKGSNCMIMFKVQRRVAGTPAHSGLPEGRALRAGCGNVGWLGTGEVFPVEGEWAWVKWQRQLIQPLWRTVWRFPKKPGMRLSYSPATPLLGTVTEKRHMYPSVHPRYQQEAT